MRTLKQFVLLLTAIFVVTFSSCSSSDDEGGEGQAASGILAAQVDGTSFNSLEISSSATVANGGKNLIIIATNSDGNAFAFTILGYQGAATYPIGGGTNIFNTASYSETAVNLSNPTASKTEIWQAPFEDIEAGSITISEETETKVIGSFSFKCKNVGGDGSVKNITKGVFNLKKQTT